MTLFWIFQWKTNTLALDLDHLCVKPKVDPQMVKLARGPIEQDCSFGHEQQRVYVAHILACITMPE